MSRTAYGSVTAKPQGGGDANVLSLGDNTRIRLLEPSAERWRQHGIQSPSDDEQFRSAVCPKGPDGRDSNPCPLCMKPIGNEVDKDGRRIQRFPMSRRFAANVWDYETQSVKVLIGGPQIFEEFDKVASAGIDPTGSDWHVIKTGSGRSTKYSMVRGDTAPFTDAEIGPDDLHDLGKYAEPTSVEKIFELLEELGIDYDALEVPSFSLEEAEAFQMPFGKKHKGETLEQIYASDAEYLYWLRSTRLEEGKYDEILLTVQVILEHYDQIEPLEGIGSVIPMAPPKAASSNGSTPKAQATTPPIPATGTVRLIGPDGSEVDVPESAADALLASGFSRAPEPQDEPTATPTLVPATDDAGQFLVRVGGTEVAVPEAAVAGLVAAGGEQVMVAVEPNGTEPESEVPMIEATDEAGNFVMTKYAEDTGEARASVPAAAVEAMKAAGYEHVMVPAQGEPTPTPLPADDDEVGFVLKALPAGAPPVNMAFKDARRLYAEGQGSFADVALEAAVDAANATSESEMTDAEAKAEVAAAVATDPTPAGGETAASSSSTADLDPKLATQREDGRWTHPALPGKDYAAKGPITQALNKLKAASPQPAAAPATDRDGKLNRVRELLNSTPEVKDDFKRMVKLFESVANKRQVTEFTDAELDTLIGKLESGDLPE